MGQYTKSSNVEISEERNLLERKPVHEPTSAEEFRDMKYLEKLWLYHHRREKYMKWMQLLHT